MLVSLLNLAQNVNLFIKRIEKMFRQIRFYKICSTFLMSIFLIAALVFSTPITIFAQQNAEVPASKTTIAPDKLHAITVAARVDAEQDVDELKWLAGSFLAGATGTALMSGSFAIYVGTELVRSSCGGDPVDCTPLVLSSGCGLALYSLPIAYATSVQPSPPPERLLGKSPEYVKAYTSVYVKNVKRLRNRSMIMGYAVPTLLGALGSLLLGTILLEDKQYAP